MAAVHPRAESFYRALLGFQINSQPLKYETLNGAAAVHISMDLSANHLNKVINSYRTKDPMKNIGALFDRPDHRYHYAPKKAGLSINPAFTPTMLKYFCLQQREVWSKFSNEDRHTLIQVYSTYFGDQSMAEFRKLADEPSLEKEFRTPIRLTAVANFFEHISFGEISDLTGQGCFINSFGHLPQPNEQIEIAFRFCDQEYRVRGKVAWLNEAQSLRHRRGMGIQFEQSIPKLALDLQKWVFSVSQPSATQEAKLARRFA